MQTKAQKIVNLIGDYENNSMTIDHVLDWVNQFDPDDKEFILEELENIFTKTYLTKAGSIGFLKKYLTFWTSTFNYVNVQDFLAHAVFLDLQAEDKSQKELLKLLDEIIFTEYGVGLAHCGQDVRHYIYLDDVLSTGGTIFNQLSTWLQADSLLEPGNSNYVIIKKKGMKVHVCLFCVHSWGRSNLEFRLMKTFDDSIKKYINYYNYYLIDNNVTGFNPKLNIMLPTEGQTADVQHYLASLDFATTHEDRAYRKAVQPAVENLFSSSASRIRLENIFLKKGVEVLNRVVDLKVKQIRPLGYTVKSHKTFGLGTLFFTYRNIPNNCPIVFWWANNNWRPLFVLKNRGNR